MRNVLVHMGSLLASLSLSSLLGLSQSAWGDSKDHLSLIHIGKGTKLVFKKDLVIPANSAAMVFKMLPPNKYNDVCYLNVEPSTEDRKLSAGREVVFSGNVLEGLPPQETISVTLAVSSPSGVRSIRCSKAWDGKPLIGEMRAAFSEIADLVFPEPSELESFE
ncbi:MAG: hypothetical protein EB078_01725 [Proteobacteria bacterium]|nr:hypothetical protein [Pseudomonadota bacterium]NDC24191.1 hypothetical protein [Pseudomonadota bacterium]NDD03600.1 hypothetical protein [Pseudomonadota bacterium]NDG25759.1 hypothetical protein [Pseudomonadota bacterium]